MVTIKFDGSVAAEHDHGFLIQVKKELKEQFRYKTFRAKHGIYQIIYVAGQKYGATCHEWGDDTVMVSRITRCRKKMR